MTENRRLALAESHFELGQTGTADELFGSWLAADPGWGFGWTVSFGGDGLPLDQLPSVMRAFRNDSGTRAQAGRVGRNAPCPCGSGKKFKKCCGGPGQPAGPGIDHAGETGHG